MGCCPAYTRCVGGDKEDDVTRSAITKTQARAYARERLADVLKREEQFIELAADWTVAVDAQWRAVERMYALGFKRSEIAERLDVPLRRVPNVDEMKSAERGAEGVSGDDESFAVEASVQDASDH